MKFFLTWYKSVEGFLSNYYIIKIPILFMSCYLLIFLSSWWLFSLILMLFQKCRIRLLFTQCGRPDQLFHETILYFRKYNNIVISAISYSYSRWLDNEMWCNMIMLSKCWVFLTLNIFIYTFLSYFVAQ